MKESPSVYHTEDYEEVDMHLKELQRESKRRSPDEDKIV